jgi:hypothetical protein
LSVHTQCSYAIAGSEKDSSKIIGIIFFILILS